MSEREFIGHRNGIIKWFNLTKGYGVLFEVGNRKEKIILQASDSKKKDLALLDRNSKVKFDLVRDHDSQLLATNVRLAVMPTIPQVETSILVKKPKQRKSRRRNVEIEYFSEEESEEIAKQPPKKKKRKGKILDAKKRSVKNWQYGFQTYPPKQKETYTREEPVRSRYSLRRRPSRYYRVSESPEYKRHRRKKPEVQSDIPVRTFSDSSEEDLTTAKEEQQLLPPTETSAISIQPLARASNSGESDPLTTKLPIASTPNVSIRPTDIFSPTANPTEPTPVPTSGPLVKVPIPKPTMMEPIHMNMQAQDEIAPPMVNKRPTPPRRAKKKRLPSLVGKKPSKKRNAGGTRMPRKASGKISPTMIVKSPPIEIPQWKKRKTKIVSHKDMDKMNANRPSLMTTIQPQKNGLRARRTRRLPNRTEKKPTKKQKSDALASIFDARPKKQTFLRLPEDVCDVLCGLKDRRYSRSEVNGLKKRITQGESPEVLQALANAPDSDDETPPRRTRASRKKRKRMQKEPTTRKRRKNVQGYFSCQTKSNVITVKNTFASLETGDRIHCYWTGTNPGPCEIIFLVQDDCGTTVAIDGKITTWSSDSNFRYILDVRVAKKATRSISGVECVFWHKARKKWQVVRTIEGTRHDGGYFQDLKEATRKSVELAKLYDSNATTIELEDITDDRRVIWNALRPRQGLRFTHHEKKREAVFLCDEGPKSKWFLEHGQARIITLSDLRSMTELEIFASWIPEYRVVETMASEDLDRHMAFAILKILKRQEDPEAFKVDGFSFVSTDMSSYAEVDDPVGQGERKSKYVGVYWNQSKKKWGVNRKLNGKNHYGGYFEDEESAGRKSDDLVYLEAEEGTQIKAHLNFPNDRLDESGYVGVIWCPETGMWVISKEFDAHKHEETSVWFDNGKHVIWEEAQKMESQTIKSQYLGVAWNKSKNTWMVRRTWKRKVYWGGEYKVELKAARESDALVHTLGAKGSLRLNFPHLPPPKNKKTSYREQGTGRSRKSTNSRKQKEEDSEEESKKVEKSEEEDKKEIIEVKQTVDNSPSKTVDLIEEDLLDDEDLDDETEMSESSSDDEDVEYKGVRYVEGLHKWQVVRMIEGEEILGQMFNKKWQAAEASDEFYVSIHPEPDPEELNFPHPKFSAMEIEELSDPEDVWTPGGRKNSPSPNPKAEKKAAEVKKKPKKPKTKPKKEVRKRAGKSSKFQNVSFAAQSGRWYACFEHNKKRYNLGYYNEERNAALAVNAQCRELGIKLRNPVLAHDLTKPEPCQPVKTKVKHRTTTKSKKKKKDANETTSKAKTEEPRRRSKYIGVNWSSRGWFVVRCLNGEKYTSEHFDDERKAAEKSDEIYQKHSTNPRKRYMNFYKPKTEDVAK